MSCEIYPLLDGNIEEFHINIPWLRMLYTVSVLGREEGYTVQYTPLPSGKGVYLTIYPELSPNTDGISF